MRKIIKVGFPILCVAVIGGTFILLNKTTDKINRNKLNENDVDNDFLKSSIIEEESSQNVLSPEEAKIQEVKNKSKAIEIIKKLAPPTTNSYWTNEGMIGDKYLVAVRDSVTKEAKIYYTVDIGNEKYEVYEK